MRRAAGLPRAADPDEPAEPADAARRDPRRSTRRCRSAPTRGSRTTAIDELVAANGAAVVVGGTGLYLRAALADLAVPPPPRRACASGSGPRSSATRRRHTRGLRSSIRARPLSCTRTTHGGSCARSSSPRRARHSYRTTIGSGRADATADTDRRARRAARRARAADRRAHGRRCSTPESSTRSARRSPRASRTRPRRRSGWRRSRRCRRTRPASGSWCEHAATPPTSASGCAAIPGLLWVDGRHGPDEVAETILAAASMVG